MLMMLQCYLRGPGDRCRLRTSRLAWRCHIEVYRQLQSQWNERDMTGVEWGERSGGRGILRDTARTSPWSHMAGEIVLYACVCLSALVSVRSRKCLQPDVCNNISTATLPWSVPFFTAFVFATAAILWNALLATMTNGWCWPEVGEGGTAFIFNSTPELLVWLIHL